MKSQTTGLITIFAAIALTVGVLVPQLLYIDKRHNQLQARQTKETMQKLVAGGTLVAVRIEQPVPQADPDSPLWNDAPAITVPLNLQAMTAPVLEKASVREVKIQALTDGQSIAWRCTWDDSSPDQNVDNARFCDSFAIQLPRVDNAPFSMGAKDMPVHILHWKALWQKDIDQHFQDVQDLHPNFWADSYWFADGKFPYPITSSFSDPRSHAWFVAKTAGNPLSQFERKSPVEELSAHGFGTLSTQPINDSVGKGRWKDGKWTVVISRPMLTDDIDDARLPAGGPRYVALAVWDGGAGNVGAKKHWSDWIPMEIQP